MTRGLIDWLGFTRAYVSLTRTRDTRVKRDMVIEN